MAGRALPIEVVGWALVLMAGKTIAAGRRSMVEQSWLPACRRVAGAAFALKMVSGFFLGMADLALVRSAGKLAIDMACLAL